jgi:hypothetical protein
MAQTSCSEPWRGWRSRRIIEVWVRSLGVNLQRIATFPDVMIKKVTLVVILSVAAAVASAQTFPLWERILKHYSGTTDETLVPTMKMGHMQMSLKAAAAPGDEKHASEILNAAAAVLIQYRDVKSAVHDGYKPFFPSGKIGEEIHYTNYHRRRLEQQHIDYSRPGSILYKRTADGLKPVGVMYTAPTDSTPRTAQRHRPPERRDLASTCRFLRRPEILAQG